MDVAITIPNYSRGGKNILFMKSLDKCNNNSTETSNIT